MILATTTSTQDSGLLDVLIPDFQGRTGYHVKPVAVGSGQALKMGEDGNADVLLVHSPDAEQAFMATGAGVDRRLVMHNLAYSERVQLKVLVEHDAPLLNIYHVIRVNPQKWPGVNVAGAQAFAEYLLSPATQQLIGSFGVEKYHQALFVPDAGKNEESLGQ